MLTEPYVIVVVDVVVVCKKIKTYNVIGVDVVVVVVAVAVVAAVVVVVVAAVAVVVVVRRAPIKFRKS